MEEYRVRIELLEPVCIATQRGVGNVIPTLDYIPGSSLRGALALLWLEEFGSTTSAGVYEIPTNAKQSEFDRLFNSDDIVFGNCYIGDARPIPMTAMTCKHNKGFDRRKGQHGVLNTLFRDTNACLDPTFNGFNLNCRVCENVGILDRLEGFYLHNGSFVQVKIRKRLIARTRVSEFLDTSHHGSFYIRLALEAKQVFEGKMKLHNAEDASILSGLLSQRENVLHIGASKSRSTGRVRISINKFKPSWPDESDLRQRLRNLHLNFDALPGCMWLLTAVSDTIIQDPYFRFKSQVTISDITQAVTNYAENAGLAEAERIPMHNILSQFDLLRGWASITQTAGWQAAWQLPKFQQTAIAAGSVFLFYCRKPPDISPEPGTGKSAEDSLLGALALLEQNGLGERRNEGFGQIKICDRFHWQEDM
ncbi:MAG: RAMP superfamily CRISPR-associated protein [bacterium]